MSKNNKLSQEKASSIYVATKVKKGLPRVEPYQQYLKLYDDINIITPENSFSSDNLVLTLVIQRDENDKITFIGPELLNIGNMKVKIIPKDVAGKIFKDSPTIDIEIKNNEITSISPDKSTLRLLRTQYNFPVNDKYLEKLYKQANSFQKNSSLNLTSNDQKLGDIPSGIEGYIQKAQDLIFSIVNKVKNFASFFNLKKNNVPKPQVKVQEVNLDITQVIDSNKKPFSQPNISTVPTIAIIEPKISKQKVVAIKQKLEDKSEDLDSLFKMLDEQSVQLSSNVIVEQKRVSEPSLKKYNTVKDNKFALRAVDDESINKDYSEAELDKILTDISQSNLHKLSNQASEETKINVKNMVQQYENSLFIANN